MNALVLVAIFVVMRASNRLERQKELKILAVIAD